MQLASHISALLRDHDCVIIPDFGGLIAEYTPASIHPVRHTLTPPAKRVAFNQALTRNDGLLVDALSRALQVPATQARQLVREAVARLQQELAETQRTELPGIGVFRHAPGRGLDFEYAGSHNLLTASFGLPELLSRPVRATDAMQARVRSTELPEPVLRTARRRFSQRTLTRVAAVLVGGLVLSANYLFALKQGYLPESLRASTTLVAQPQPQVPVAEVAEVAPAVQTQRAALAQPTWEEPAAAAKLPEAPAAKPAAPAKPVAATPKPAAPKMVAPKPAAPVAKVPVAAPKAVASPVVKSAVEPTILYQRTGRYYVVAGCYKSKTAVLKDRAGRKAGATVLAPVAGSLNYRLTVANYPDKATADRSLPALRKQFGNTIWVMKY